MVREKCVPLKIDEPTQNQETVETIQYSQDVLDGKVEAKFYDNAQDLLAAARA